MSTIDENLKRFYDCIASICGMIVFSPLFLIIMILIKCDSKGPVIFSQERIGKGGKPFTLYKFRTMNNSSEADGKPKLCQENDERLTKVGKFLRDHHLDELPQLWCVARGSMSFVGPRPERKYYIDKIMEVNPDYERLYELRPGLFSEATLTQHQAQGKHVVQLRQEADGYQAEQKGGHPWDEGAQEMDSALSVDGHVTHS